MAREKKIAGKRQKPIHLICTFRRWHALTGKRDFVRNRFTLPEMRNGNPRSLAVIQCYAAFSLIFAAISLRKSAAHRATSSFCVTTGRSSVVFKPRSVIIHEIPCWYV